MNKLYPAGSGKLCLSLLFSLLLTFFAHAQIVTYDTTFDGWNAIVTEDLSLHGTDSAPGIVFFPGIGEQTKNIEDLSVNGPHYLIKNGIWDGSVTLGNGVHHPFIISLQPPTAGYPAMVVKPKIDAILARYRIKRNSLYFTGLSMGSWQANEFLTYQATPGDHTYGRMVKAMVNLEGVEPADYTGIYSSLPYPNKMGDWAKACGGRELWVEGAQDWRDMQAGAQNMIDAVPGSATYFQVTYGGGAHCCWNTEYDPRVTWTKSSNSNISQVVGQQEAMNVWQWLLRQGDTSMPVSSAVASVAPTASAGSAQTITLPTSSATLTGAATANNGATIKSTGWKQVSGPVTASIASPSSLTTKVTGLSAAGSYVFQLTATDNANLSAASSMTVVVAAAAKTATAAPTPPTVSAGPNQTIVLPTTAATLTGKATGNGGATVNSYFWMMVSGPSWVKFSNEWGLSTSVSGLMAGTYVFELSASDNHNMTSTSLMTIIVEAAASAPVAAKPATPAASTATAAKTPPTVSAGKGQKITLPASSAELSGTAAATAGAKIVTTTWAQVSGPEKVKFASPSSLSTAVTGLTEAGSYIFNLIAIDNNGKSSNGSMTVTVEPSAVKTPPTVSAGANQTITLPTNAVKLNGSAAGTGGAVVNSYFWFMTSGPSFVKFSNEWALSTSVSGLAAGTYVFELSASDNHDMTSTSTMTVVVKPKSTTAAAPGSMAMSGDAAAMTDSAMMDSTGHAESLLIFPNPVHDLLNIRLNNVATGKVIVMILNAKGNRVQALELEKDRLDLETAVDVSRLAQGVYFLEILTGTHLRNTQQFIKQ